MTDFEDASASRAAQLTQRERAILAYLLRGAANKVIALEMGISQRTVEMHRANLYRKLRVRNSVALVRLFYTTTTVAPCFAEPQKTYPAQQAHSTSGGIASLSTRQQSIDHTNVLGAQVDATQP